MDHLYNAPCNKPFEPSILEKIKKNSANQKQTLLTVAMEFAGSRPMRIFFVEDLTHIFCTKTKTIWI